MPVETLRPPRKRTTVMAVIDCLQDYIVDNRLRPGDRLPPELSLAARLGVSRVVIREALRYFKTLGLIDSKPKVGAYLRSLVPITSHQHYAQYLRGGRNCLLELEQTRWVIECGMIPLWIETLNADALNRLGELARRMETVTGAELARLDAEFHACLLAAPGNPLLFSLKPLIIDYFLEVEKHHPVLHSREGKRIAKEHGDIVDALRRKDKRTLRHSIDRHYGRKFS